MVLSVEREPWKRDDVLVSAFSVEWVAKNVFLIAVPAYRRKVSCELTAVDVPRGAAPAITERTLAVLSRVNNAMRLYLRQDFYSNFPLEGYGDVIFSAEAKSDTACQLHWCSLQEALVEAGVACVVRPSVVRQEPLLAAERNAGSSKGREAEWSASWLCALHERERSALCCVTRRCVVEDVVRGDVYRVSWQPSAAAAAPAVADLPPLLILDATVCHSPSTEVGFAALRWAQLHLLHCELTVQVHAVYPCDKDVAFNTQLETFEHLANVRGSASVAQADDGSRSNSSNVDIGVALVTKGLAWVRRVADAGVPRASNLFAAFHAIAEAAAVTVPVVAVNDAKRSNTGNNPPEDDAAVCAQLGKAWALPASAVPALLRFHDTWWRRACWAALSEGTDGQRCDAALTAARATLTAAKAGVGATAEVWKRYVWCADVHEDPNDTPRIYTHRPLRTLFPLAGLAEWRVRLRGSVDGAVVVHAGDHRRFLQVDVVATTAVAEWRELRRLYGYADLDAVRFSPTPGDAVLGKKVKVTITASSFGQDVEPRLRVCCTSYSASGFSLAQHKPSGVWPIKEGGRCEEELSIDGTAREERVFVLDVVVEARDEDSMTWTTRGTGRAVYLLSPDVDSEAVDTADKEEEGKNSGAATAAAGAEAERQKDSAALQPTQYYQTSMSFFFELKPYVDGVGLAEDPLIAELKRVFADLMYEDVVALPVGVAEVCGVRGLVGDLFFPREPAPRTATNAAFDGVLRERAPQSFTRSLLSSIGRPWWPSPTASRDNASPSSAAPTAWPLSTTVYETVQRSFTMCLEKVMAEEWAARQSLMKEAEWLYQVLEQEALNTFAAYRRQATPWRVEETAPPPRSATQHCLYFTAGTVALWRDDDPSSSASGAARRPARLQLPSSLLPPTVPLSLFAIRPRELFSVASSQKMKTTTQRKGAPPPKTLLEKSYDQQDWAFMRLRFPFLPNILQCNWERLPISLRNTERALCEAVVRDRGFVRQPGMLYTTDRIFSLFLSYLALLQSMQASGESSGDGNCTADASSSPPSALAAVFQALRQSTPSIWDDLRSAMHFSATLFVLPPFHAPEPGADAQAAPPVKHSRPLFLGSRDNVVADAFEVPRRDNAAVEVVALPLLRDLTSQCVSAVAVEALVVEKDAAEEEEDWCDRGRRSTPAAGTVVNLDDGRQPDQLRTITSQGLPWRLAHATTPVLYHPLPRIAVLASPLVEREEYSPDALGRLQLDHNVFDGVRAEAKDAAMVRRRVVLQYRCINKYHEKSPYRPISYGRVSSVDMFKTLISDRSRGKEVQAYMSLLLRRSVGTPGSAAAAFPDGLLTLHGVPAEPLYVHYRSRADLRFTLGTICPPLRESLLRAEHAAPPSPQTPRDAATEASVEEAETALLTLYAEAAAAYVRKIYQRVRKAQHSGEAAQQISLVFTLQPWDDTTPPYIAIQVFPVYPNDAEVTERVLNQERIWHDATAYENNPHKAFSLLGTRFGRLAMAELRIRYDTANGCFHAAWNEMFESGVEPAAAST